MANGRQGSGVGRTVRRIVKPRGGPRQLSPAARAAAKRRRDRRKQLKQELIVPQLGGQIAITAAKGKRQLKRRRR